MIEHLTQKQVEDCCRQQLSAAELLSVSDHLGECEACRRRIEKALNGDASFLALRSAVLDDEASQDARVHLTLKQTSDYVDGKLSGEGLQMVADHLSHCEQCALMVDDLGAFKNEIGPSLDREYHPALVPSQDEGWWHQSVASLQGLFRRPPVLAFGAALAALLLVVTGWLILRAPSQRTPSPEVAVAPTRSPQPTPVPVVAQLTDGEGQLTLDQEGRLSGAESLPAAYQNLLKEALTTQRLERSSQLEGLSRPSSSLMSTDQEGHKFSVIEPVGTVLMTDRPTFRWSLMQGATGYIVEVYDSRFNPMATSPQISGNSWVLPRSLPRGSVYTWQVKAMKDGQEFTSPRPPAPQAAFRILDQAKANELVSAKRAYGSSHLVMGLLYAEAGLLKEAEQQLRELQNANPDSEIAQKLLGKIRALRR